MRFTGMFVHSVTDVLDSVNANGWQALHQMHRDVVPRYPASVEKLGYSDRCEVQGIYVTNRVMTMQGHPEYDAMIACELLERRRGSVLDKATYRDGMDRVRHSHDGVTVGAAFLRFLIKE